MWLYDNGFSKNSMSSCKGIITKSLEFAVDKQYIAYSPAKDVKLPKVRKAPKIETRTKERDVIDKDMLEKIFDRFNVNTPYYVPMMIAYHCGLRLGEVYALTWDDIDLEKKTLEVNRQVQWMADSTRTAEDKKENNGKKKCNGYWYFSAPKYESYRTIQMDDTITELLKRTKLEQDAKRQSAKTLNQYLSVFVDSKLYHGGCKPKSPAPDNRIYLTELTDIKKFVKANLEAEELEKAGKTEIFFVNSRSDGSYITPRTMQHASSVIHHQLDFKEFDFHSFRHTHATELLEAGASIIYISERLGHCKIETTERYANHLTANMKNKGNEIMNNLH